MRTEFERSITNPEIVITYKRKTQFSTSNWKGMVTLLRWILVFSGADFSSILHTLDSLALESQQPQTHQRSSKEAKDMGHKQNSSVHLTESILNIAYKFHQISSSIPADISADSYLLIPFIPANFTLVSPATLSPKSEAQPQLTKSIPKHLGLCHLQFQITLGDSLFQRKQ